VAMWRLKVVVKERITGVVQVNILAKRKMAIVIIMRIAKVILSVETTTAHGEIMMIAVRNVQHSSAVRDIEMSKSHARELKRGLLYTFCNFAQE